VSTTPGFAHLAAIINGDVAGYSRLMAEDEEATARLFAACRAEIEKCVSIHHGRMIDFTGDNFLAEMQSVSDAVACGIEIQRTLRERNAPLPTERRLEFRIGIHLGDLHTDGTRVYGQGVNVAARLQQLAQPGHLCISAAVHEVVKSRLDVPCEDLGSRRVKNVPEPVHAFHLDVSADPDAVRRHPASRRNRLRRTALAAGAVIILGLLAVWATWPLTPGILLEQVGLHRPPAHPELPDIPSIAVLPFENLSPDPDQAFFTDGLTEALTSKLASLDEIFVISRNSAYAYEGRNMPVHQIGRELGVRYVLEGSVQREGRRIRVTAQLIDAPTDFHVWSESFDRQLEDVFELQSRITERILHTLQVEIREAEIERIRRKPTDDLSAYDAFMRAEGLFLRFTRADTEAAREFLRRALELDPNYAQAHGLLAGTYQAAYTMMWDPDPEYLVLARRHARRAIQLNPLLAQPHRVMALLLALEERWDDALRESELATELAPNDELAHIAHFRMLAATGEIGGAVESTRRAMRLNPRSPTVSWASLAFIHAALGDREGAAELLERVRAANPEILPAMAFLAYHYEDIGDHAEASRCAEEILAVNPDLTAEMTLHWLSPLADPEDVVEDLRRAGLR
jgi:adenylate cyclase